MAYSIPPNCRQGRIRKLCQVTTHKLLYVRHEISTTRRNSISSSIIRQGYSLQQSPSVNPHSSRHDTCTPVQSITPTRTNGAQHLQDMMPNQFLSSASCKRPAFHCYQSMAALCSTRLLLGQNFERELAGCNNVCFYIALRQA